MACSPPRGSADDFAVAAFSVLRARAARKLNSQTGLTGAVRCALFEGPVWAGTNQCCILYISTEGVIFCFELLNPTWNPSDFDDVYEMRHR